ncbi:Uncharacterized protein LSUE1_G002255 [Lachnellula suecica]|uniref:Mitochondrial K+-H+ exchange-related-domain-containing protein n=1 Tax=Lachnellula suecica TaxID=602035 RepID=A0A8T9CBW1_9HELO|nr:Uncharacterized protein LSUE1_G002255 [Lachnellula suecica]
MRLFLLPISTRRTLIYCQRLNVTTTEPTTLVERYSTKLTTKAADLWAGWEKKESGWQKKLVDYGNVMLKRIPYEEWGLKSIPSLSARRKAEDLAGKGDVEVSYPESLIPEERVKDLLRKLGTERQAYHKKYMIWSFVGMPIVAPFALVPVIPNIPFFYLVFRAWSHWRALGGSKHLEFLLENKFITPKPSKILNAIYSSGNRPFDASSVPTTEKSSIDPIAPEEKMVLHKADGKVIAEALGIPELNVELDRAVWQVEKALQAEKELKEEKKELDTANSEAKPKK